MQQATRFVISGTVQGVGFRASAQREARRSGVRGWVRNLPNGGVEVVADAPDMRIFVEWLNRGPRLAHVRDVARTTVEVPALPEDFQIR